VESSWTKNNNEDVVGTITLVCNLESKELTERLRDLQRENRSSIISTVLVHLDHHNCLQVLIVRGESQRVKSMSDKLIGMKGVKHGQLTMSATGAELY
jgi:CopG family nickel-responsive transcriptional regulator